MPRFRISQQFISGLSKGTVISKSEVIRFFPKHRTEDEFRLLLLAFKVRVERALKEIGNPCTLRIRENGTCLAILTDSEASQYNRRAHRSYLRRAGKRHRKMIEVDVSSFTDEERRSHDRAICVQAAIQSGIETTRRALEPKEHKRSTPVLLTTEG